MKDAIDSILSQTYNNIEYIIIDGASVDGTVEITKALKIVAVNERSSHTVPTPHGGGIAIVYFISNVFIAFIISIVLMYLVNRFVDSKKR
jgi:glycosyltransferase involved in cell wall biosynthesis